MLSVANVRTAGGAAQLMAREGQYAVILMPSGELRRIHIECMATIGRVGNTDHQNVKLGKAGCERATQRPGLDHVAEGLETHFAVVVVQILA